MPHDPRHWTHDRHVFSAAESSLFPSRSTRPSGDSDESARAYTRLALRRWRRTRWALEICRDGVVTSSTVSGNDFDLVVPDVFISINSYLVVTDRLSKRYYIARRCFTSKRISNTLVAFNRVYGKQKMSVDHTAHRIGNCDTKLRYLIFSPLHGKTTNRIYMFLGVAVSCGRL